MLPRYLPMNRVPFTSLVFRGARFESGAMPVEALGELLVYRDLVIAMAEELYRAANPSRIRVPKGFSARLQLVLAQQERGSTVPILDRIVATPPLLPGLGLFPPPDEFDDALDAVRTTFDEAARGVSFSRVPPAFANRLLAFGKTLRDDESIVLGTVRDRAGPVVDRHLRRKIQRLAGGPYEEPIELIGTVRAADRDRDSFGLRTTDAVRVEVLSPGALFSRVLESLADDTLVRVRGTGLFDANGDRVGKVRAHEINLAEEGDGGSSMTISQQFADLANLPVGWLDGEGAAYDSKALDGLKALVEALVQSSGLPVPYIYPRVDGGVQAEWSGANVEVAANFAIDGASVELLATRLDNGTVREATIGVRESGGELRLAKFLDEVLRGAVR
jgi:hypothetical protein